ncbi:GPALPP motifs-containing protein 1-like [Mergus octosetaceus]
MARPPQTPPAPAPAPAPPAALPRPRSTDGGPRRTNGPGRHRRGRGWRLREPAPGTPKMAAGGRGLLIPCFPSPGRHFGRPRGGRSEPPAPCPPSAGAVPWGERGELELSGARHSTSMWLGKVSTSSEEEDTIMGPMPAKGPVESDVTKEFERRAQRMKEKLTSAGSLKDADSGFCLSACVFYTHFLAKPVPRQSWMTELPPELKNFGFGPRTFKRRADDKSGDRSVWTDTPADRERKAKEREEAKKSRTVLSGRDKRLAEQVTSYSESKRPESLLDVHQKKLKSKASEEKTKPQERRPFDREQDLKVNRFDEAQKNLYLLIFLIQYEYCEIKFFFNQIKA